MNQILILYLFLFSSSCQPSSTEKNTVLGSSANSCDLLTDSVNLPKVINYGNKSHIKMLERLNGCQRRQLMINNEGATKLRWSGEPLLISKPLRILEVPTHEVNVVRYSDNGIYLSETDKPQFGLQETTNKVMIPVHPSTRKHHPLIQKFIDKGYPLVPSQQVISTMSRSVWYNSENTLATIKVGTDYVDDSPQKPEKLTDVYDDIIDQNDILINTSMRQMISDLSVTYLVESKAFAIEPKSRNFFNPAANARYGIALRDYNNILEDKNRIYLPLASLANRGKIGCKDEYLVRYGFDKFIKIPFDEMSKMIRSLNEDLARVIAIHHANGYMPVDFHGQNLLVGIPLDPTIPARLVIRDVADIYPFQFKDTSKSNWAGLAVIKAAEFPQSGIENYQAKAYKDQMKKLGFFPSNSWDAVPESLTMRDIVLKTYQSNQKNFWSEVDKFRQQHCSLSKDAARIKQCQSKVFDFTRKMLLRL